MSQIITKKICSKIHIFLIIIFIIATTGCVPETVFKEDEKMTQFSGEEEIISEGIPEPAEEKWVLVWSDEFNGTGINRDNWSFDIGTGNNGWGNNELQYYTDRPGNIRIEDGALVIEARKEDYEDSKYTSARIKTEHKKFWTYGKIEARIKLPRGKGIWPAFWMLGESFNATNWPGCGEIDIMEMIGGGSNDGTCHCAIYWDKDGLVSAAGSTILPDGIFADDYHVFGIDWDKEAIRWFLDGKKYHTENITNEDQSELHDNFFIILNCAVGGNWPGSPLKSTIFPQKMLVDWVRVYQKI